MRFVSLKTCTFIVTVCLCMLIRPADIPEYEMLLSSDSIIAPVRADGDGEKYRVRTHIGSLYQGFKRTFAMFKVV